MATRLSSDSATEAAEQLPSGGVPIDVPVVIEARGIEKTFRIPSHRIDSLKERAVHPFTSTQYRELHALRQVSFDVHEGEFFGILGRNGSGKSTLLKVLASIYRADAGRIRMAGIPAPFIELGVGFNPDLTARENVVLNGVMMGLSQREARRRLEAVLEFAELQEFVDLKLKNYSSGMMVRLAFSVMIQADSDILLIDEVLAVGDAAFQQKCRDTFREMRDAGRTIVLVTHDMGAVQSFCHRAMLLHDGELAYIGEAEQAAREYMRLNFGGIGGQPGQPKQGDVHARLVDAWLENGAGERVTNVELGESIRFGAVVEARRELPNPIFGFHCKDADGALIFKFHRDLSVEDRQPNSVSEGQRVRITGTIDNQLAPGRYILECWLGRRHNPADQAFQGIKLFDFVIFSAAQVQGVVSPRAEVEAVPELGRGP
jgi:ABC-type polysaccharide/polyol phosphate transport system ATPase subunit